jgi:hypothetical protein
VALFSLIIPSGLVSDILEELRRGFEFAFDDTHAGSLVACHRDFKRAQAMAVPDWPPSEAVDLLVE